MTVEKGLEAEIKRVVGAPMSAEAYGNTGFPVLGTPALIGLLEEAGIKAVTPGLGPNEGTVGTRINIAHLAATPLGEEVRVHARVIEVDGRRLVFELDASDAVRPIAKGEMERFLVDIPRFLAKTVRSG
jgi:fluoroacetyl-CoA thioesterase